MKLLDFIKQGEEEPDWSENLDRQVRRRKKELEDPNDQKALAELREQIVIEKKVKWELDLVKKWEEKVIKVSQQERPFLINMTKVIDPIRSFILPVFLKPGRCHMVIRTPSETDGHYKWFYNRHIIDVREPTG